MKSKVTVPVTIEDESLLPSYATEGASGADVRAFIQDPIEIQPGETKIIPTGLKVEIPVGYEIQVRPRSGFAAKHGLTVLNTPGTIDADFRGEIGVILINHGKKSFLIEPQMRIAQLVLTPVLQAEFMIKEELVETCRGEGRFGHTGTK